MYQKSYYINQNITETSQFVKDFIGQSKGKIVQEDSRRILWSYRYGLDYVECETLIKPQRNGTKITTKSSSEDIESPKAQIPIQELYDSLAQNFKSKEVKIYKRKKPSKSKKRSEPVISSTMGLKITFGIILVLFFAIAIMNDDGQPQIYITNEGFYATSSRKDLDAIESFKLEQDLEAVQQFLNQARVITLAPNREVFLVASDWGAVKIRPKGMTYELWVLREAIRRK